MRIPQEVVTLFETLPDTYRGSVTFHFDGQGPAECETMTRQKFERKQSPPRRRVIVHVTDEKTEP